MLRRSFLAGLAATGPGSAARAAAPSEFDVLLVLAIDASGSLSDERLTLQREGHARAVESDEFLAAVGTGHVGRVALAVVEWSNQDRQDATVPWTIVQDAATARAFAATLRRAPRPIPGVTSISGALDFSVRLLSHAPYSAARRVVDISGNGRNNDGRPVAAARDDAIGLGITINGLPILDAERDLDAYYAREVIGGAGAFLVAAGDIASFQRAIVRKLALEVAATGSEAPRSDAARAGTAIAIA